MNFYAHAFIAARRDVQPSWVFGAMAPDFAAMAGMRLIAVNGDCVLAEGVEFHHRSDDAFHGAPIFIELMEQARVELQGQGLGFGPAAGIGHVGVEMILDGVLVERHGLLDCYVEAMAAAEELEHHLHFPGVDRRESALRWQLLFAWLRRARIPLDYGQPVVVADLLFRTLASRPALALCERDAVVVHDWALRWRPRVAERTEALLEQVEQRLRMSSVGIKNPEGHIRST